MANYYNKYLKYKTKYLELKSNNMEHNNMDMIGGGKNNKFILVDGTSSSGKSTIRAVYNRHMFFLRF